MKEALLILLQRLSKKVIEKHKPFIVGITGTVGKTTTTHFIYDFLHAMHGDKVYMSPHNYNGEFGVPFTILQVKSPYSNPFLWIWVFIKGFMMLFSKKYPRYLVLEYGIDHVGEMDYMLHIAKPDIAVLLNVSRNHVVHFPRFSEYVEEKMKLLYNAKKVVFNLDNDNIVDYIQEHELDKPMIPYGIINKHSNLSAKNIHAGLEKLSYTLSYNEKEYEMSVPLIGEYQVYNILPVFGVGIHLGMDIHDIQELLHDLHPQKGRGSILKGLKESVIIDGSYNGGYASIGGGVKYMHDLEDDYNKILFLGDMRELGDESKKLHTDIAEMIRDSSITSVVLVGDEMKKYIYPVLLETWGPDRVFSFLSSRVAGKKVRELILSNEQKSVIFVKGSQNTIYLEEGIKDFLYDIRDSDKLCRQSDHWMRIKNHFFESVIADV